MDIHNGPAAGAAALSLSLSLSVIKGRFAVLVVLNGEEQRPARLFTFVQQSNIKPCRKQSARAYTRSLARQCKLTPRRAAGPAVLQGAREPRRRQQAGQDPLDDVDAHGVPDLHGELPFRNVAGPLHLLRVHALQPQRLVQVDVATIAADPDC